MGVGGWGSGVGGRVYRVWVRWGLMRWGSGVTWGSGVGGGG